MPEKSQPEPDGPRERASTGRRDREKEAADVFGDLLPDTTRDESAEAWGDRDGSRDDELMRDVPPHHG